MNYRIYTRPSLSGDNIYVVLEINGKKVTEKYCTTILGARWVAYWINQNVKTGKYMYGHGNIYEGSMND